MYKYKVQIKRVSGRLNESVLPDKVINIESQTRMTDKQAFNEASNYLKSKFGLVLEMADVKSQDALMLDYVAMEDPNMDIDEMWDIADDYLARGYYVQQDGDLLFLYNADGQLIGKQIKRDTSQYEVRNPYSTYHFSYGGGYDW